MKPQTKIEKEVVELSAKLTPPTIPDVERMKRVGVEHTALYTGKRVKCTECGHVWKQTGLNRHVRCPHCKKLLKVKETRAKKAEEVEYSVILQSCKSWQVARYFRVRWSCPVNGGRTYAIHEVVQHWLRTDGRHVIMARPRFMSFYIDSFSLWKPMSIKYATYKFSYMLPFTGVIVKSVNPILKRNGFKCNLYGMHPMDLFKLILKNPFAETLIKTGYGNLLSVLTYERKLSEEEYVAAAKIVMRNKYQLTIDDAGLWLDMVKNLLVLGKDVRNRKYVCPVNLKAAHDKAQVMVERKREREAAERMKEQIRKDKKLARTYEKRIKRFFGLNITDGKIVICVLKNVEEFEKEGTSMHHCVFTNKYFAKPNSLIMSAKVDGKRQETIEVNLERFELVQSRAVNNGVSKYHKKIVDLVNDNMWKIQKLKARC